MSPIDVSLVLGHRLTSAFGYQIEEAFSFVLSFGQPGERVSVHDSERWWHSHAMAVTVHLQRLNLKRVPSTTCVASCLAC
jgi:hypothetical protein